MACRKGSESEEAAWLGPIIDLAAELGYEELVDTLRVERSNGTVAQDAKPEAKPEAKAKREAEATQPEAKAAQPPKATPAPGPATLSTSVATREVTLPADSEIVNMEEESIVATDTAAQGARNSAPNM